MDLPRRPSRYGRKLRLATLLAGGVAVLAAVTLALKRLEPAVPAVPRSGLWTGVVARGPMVREVRAPGTFVPERIWWIPATTEGRVARVLAQPGTVVEPDTLLVELENPAVSRAVLDAELEVKSQEAERLLLEVQLDNRELDVRASVAAARASLAEQDLRNQVNEELAKSGLVGTLEIKVARIRIEALANVLEIEEKRLASRAPSAQAELAANDARLSQARALLELRRSEVVALSVRAGIAGVLEQLDVEVGQRVAPGATIAMVSDPSRLKAVLRVAEAQIPEIVLGNPVRVDTRNGIVSGRVARIHPAVTAGSVPVDVALEGELPRGARPRQNVDATIELERLEDVLYVGRPLHAQANAVIGLFKLDHERTSASRTAVRIGRTSVSNVEVQAGLVEGDEVVLNDMQAWDGKDRIRLDP